LQANESLFPAGDAGPIVGVALRSPVDSLFHYTVPLALQGRLAVGHAVQVPFGRRFVSGVVVELDPAPTAGIKLKPVSALLMEEPVIEPDELPFYRWVARYYRYPLGQVLAAALPPQLHQRARGHADDGPDGAEALLGPPTVEVVRLESSLTAALSAFSRPGPVRDRLLAYLERFGEVEVRQLVAQFSGARRIVRQLQDRQLVRVEHRRVDSPLESEDVEADSAPDLTGAQRSAVDDIEAARREGGFKPLLLHGVTGSGKTEVYLRAAQTAIEAGGGVLVLVPEIALTPQLVDRFAARLESPMAVLHSGLTAKQRFDRWRSLREGTARIAIGARSAVFAPVKDLALIVVDEEHDGSYKQEEGLRYHGRDVAVVRASQLGIPVVLGSATPALESFHNARRSKYGMLSLPSRVHERPLPDVTVVDLREEKGGEEARHRLLTEPLMAALTEVVERDEQAILLLNRRGHSSVVLCGSCGGSFECPDCDVSMTYHGRRNMLLCHYCGRSTPRPARCPHCNDAALEEVGEGTERIEEGLAEMLPGLRVDRMDRDTTQGRGAHARILERFRRGDIQVLVGTQMVAKGHDFPRVTLVGVLHADAALNLPDFRAGERTFALLTQVAGRAGRGEIPGRVLVQTFTPHHEAIRHALGHDYDGYARRLLDTRRAVGYPPFSRLALLRFSHKREGTVRQTARRVGDRLRRAVRSRGGTDAGLRLLGPAPAPMPRIAGRYRWNLLLLAPGPALLSTLLADAQGHLDEAAKVSGIRLAVDVDPQSML